MTSQNWAPVAAQIASAGAPILGGPAGGAIGDLVGSIVGRALGAPANPAAISGAIQADPAGASPKIAAAEAAHADAVQELEARLADVASARSQTVGLAKSGSQIAWGAPVVSAIVTVAFCIICAWAVVHGVSDSPVTQMLVGVLATAFANVVGYWLGSSFGSHAKDQTIGAAVAAVTRK